MPEQAPLHPVVRHHLGALTDDVGIVRDAIGSRPDPSHGYRTEDVALALLVDLLHGRELGWPAVADSAWRSVRFIGAAFDPAVGRFRSLRRIDGSWADGIGSEACHGRAIWALGEAVAISPDRALTESAAALLTRALPATGGLTVARAQASALLGCDAALRAAPGRATARAHRQLAERLGEAFRPGAASAWPWPEPQLASENGLPVQALIVAGVRLGSRPMVDGGLELLDWLISVQTAPAGHLFPIGDGWSPRGGEIPAFDQRPIEATSLLLAAEVAYRATDHGRYRIAMERAYAWFLGRNDLRVEVADPASGASGDGLTPRGVDANQGAESTLAWLIALEHVRSLRGERSFAARSQAPGHVALPSTDELTQVAVS